MFDRRGRQVASIEHSDGAVVLAMGDRTVRAADLAELERQLVTRLGPIGDLRPSVQQRPWATHPSHILTLVFLASHWPAIRNVTRPQGTVWDLTLAYALPLYLSSRWRRWCLRNAVSLTESCQLVAARHADLTLVRARFDPERHRRTLARVAHVQHRTEPVPDGFITDWAEFSQARFNVEVPQVQQQALRAIFEMAGANLTTVTSEGEVVARNLTLVDPVSRVLYDVMLTWPASAAWYRPGIVTGLLNLRAAALMGGYLSLGYGPAPYKKEIVRGCDSVGLEQVTGGLGAV